MDSQEAGDWMAGELGQRIDNWVKEAVVSGRTLVYRQRGKGGDQFPLLRRSGIKAWDWQTVPDSMREVEGGVLLISSTRMLPHDQQNSHPWQAQPDEGSADGSQTGTTTEQEA